MIEFFHITADVEREGLDECFEDGDQKALGDFLDRTDDFELGDLR